MVQNSESTSKSQTVQVNTADTGELIRLTEALDELSTKIDRIGGVVAKLYQLTERLELRLKNSPLESTKQQTLEEPVIEWINNKLAKKRKKELEKWRKKKGKKKKKRKD